MSQEKTPEQRQAELPDSQTDENELSDLELEGVVGGKHSGSRKGKSILS